ncbi:unnamed protein product [Bursaphelenchus xylophilus]|uniref:(pine wood nematode) hypothetical protein n=1 Tax=Bursaphelenchus xylophilus TaxID=6326 RepID=A0A1I7RMF9_BURXY|nr:unnamed protein product [Bursaphelenchus xylophilus]CAG9118453.1 unnamed protein product [Bursaphelenchus xylophilus]
MPLPRTDVTEVQRRYNVAIPLNRVTSSTLTPLNVDAQHPHRQPPLAYGLSAQLQKRAAEESASATPATLRLDSEATDSSGLSPNSDATPRPTSTDMSRRQIQMQRAGGAADVAAQQLADVWTESGYRRRFYEKNQHIPYDEQSHSDRSPPSERQQKYGQSLKRSPNSQPRQMDVGSLAAPSSQFSPSELSDSVAENQRRGSRGSQQIRQSMSQYDLTAGAMAVYNPVEHQMMMPPPAHPMMSHAPSMGQLWFPPPPPPFTPYYYAPTLSATPLTADSKTLRKAMKEAAKLEEKHQMAMNGYVRTESFCCDGVAQVLWAVICITFLGLALALVLALYVLTPN